MTLKNGGNMKLQVTINKRHRKLFESFLESILPISYQVDVFSNHKGYRSRYEIPYENEDQKRTIQNIVNTLR
jgi:hypothetical protein